MGCPEKKTVPNYQPTLRNIPKGWRSYLHRNRSLKARTCLFDSETWIVWQKWYAKSVWWNANGGEPSRVLSFRTSRVYANDYYLLLLIQNSVNRKLPLECTGSITTPTTSMNYETFVSLNRERGSVSFKDLSVTTTTFRTTAASAVAARKSNITETIVASTYLEREWGSWLG